MKRVKEARNALLIGIIHNQWGNTASVSVERVCGSCLISNRLKQPRSLVDGHSSNTGLRRRSIIGSGCHPRFRGPGSIAKRGPAESLVQLSVLGGVEVFISSGGGQTGFVLRRRLALL